jgi:hypothetical protein
VAVREPDIDNEATAVALDAEHHRSGRGERLVPQPGADPYLT